MGNDSVPQRLQPCSPLGASLRDARRLPRGLRLTSTCGPSVSVQSAGKPINVSTHAGLSEPDPASVPHSTCSESGRLFRSAVASLARPERRSLAVGVAQGNPSDSFAATASGIPAPFPCFALSVSARASHVSGASESLRCEALGVGLADTSDGSDL